MTSVTIIISHFESLNFLHAAIKQIRKFKREDILQHIIVADQSRDLYHNNIVAQYWGDEDITVVKMLPLYSGYGLDFILRNVEIKSEYICCLHVDAFPIHKNWLYLSIKLLEENLLHFVGQLQCMSLPTDTIYPPSKGFFAMAQSFNVARTETYKEMSLEAGFTRFHNRGEANLQFYNDDWAAWAAEDYQARGSDDDIVAFHWEDKYREHDKLGLAITGYVEKSFGRIIEDVVLHFGSCRESIGVINQMSDGYRKYLGRINNGYTEELISEMVSLAKANQPPQEKILRRNHWDGKLKISTSPSEALSKRIEELKNE